MTNLAAVIPVADLIELSPVPSGKVVTEVPDPQLVEAPHPVITSHDFNYDDMRFRVLVIGGGELTRSAASLLEYAYSQLGYLCRHARSGIAASVSLQAAVNENVIGTMSVTLDSRSGIQAESLYQHEISHFRRRGKICEFTRLAVDSAVEGREVLCSLFYVAYVYAHLVHGATDLFIEVNPRHASFYKRMLGFQQLGDAKHCPRVGAPAVLLHLDFRYTALQIERARRGLSVDSSRLYKHAATADVEQLLTERIARGEAS